MIMITANCDYLPSPCPSTWGKLSAPSVDLNPRCSLPIAFPTSQPSQSNSFPQYSSVEERKPTMHRQRQHQELFA